MPRAMQGVAPPAAGGWAWRPRWLHPSPRPALDALQAEMGGLRLGSVFGDGMVLAAPEASIFGFAHPGQQVRLALDGEGGAGEALADAEGRWSLALTGLAPGGPHALSLETNVTRKLSDVYFGQVFLATGASNMHHPLADIAYDCAWGEYEQRWRLLAREVIEQGPNPQLRVMVVHKHDSLSPRLTSPSFAPWQVARPDQQDLGALPFLFGASLQLRERVPVGIVQAVAGGTPSAEWLRRHPQAERNYYNGMMAPMAGFNFTAVLMAQGESERAYDGDMSGYRDRLKTWMRQLREDAGHPQLPVIVIGHAGIGARQTAPVEAPEGPRCDDVFNVREGQIAAVRGDPRAAYVVTSDIGDAVMIHYPNKWEVARRAIEAHRRLVHHAGDSTLSPLLRAHAVQGREVVVSFAERTQPIAPGRRQGCIGPTRELSFSEARGLAVAGADDVWRAANASFDGQYLRVWSDEVAEPSAARYAWARNPVGNLYTFPDGMPVAPWRTDRHSLTPPVSDSAPCTLVRRRPHAAAHPGGELCPA